MATRHIRGGAEGEPHPTAARARVAFLMSPRPCPRFPPPFPQGVEVLFCWAPPVDLPEKLLPSLRMIVSLGAGFDHMEASASLACLHLRSVSRRRRQSAPFGPALRGSGEGRALTRSRLPPPARRGPGRARRPRAARSPSTRASRLSARSTPGPPAASQARPPPAAGPAIPFSPRSCSIEAESPPPRRRIAPAPAQSGCCSQC